MSWIGRGDTAGAAPASATGGERSRSPGDAIVGVNARRRAKWIVPLGVTACYVLFALAVHLRMLDPLDMAVRRATHAGEVWGPRQIRAARVADGLKPTHLALPLLVIVAWISLFRRSLRPFVVLAVVGGVAIFATLGTKWVMAHTEKDATPVTHGSFPSGHAVSVIIAFGLVVLLFRPHTRWGWMLPALIGCLMGGALLIAVVHTATDIVGAGLLAVAVLTGATAAKLGEWARGRRRDSVG